MEFDINNFPTRASAKRMLSRITGIYEKSYVGKWIFEVMGAEIDPAREKIEELKLQASPWTATWGLKYWEQRYGIFPDESIPIERRRQKVLSCHMPKLPMNPVRMEKILSVATGREVKVKENIAPYTFRITIDGNSSTQVNLADLFEQIDKIKPAHQSYQVAIVKNTHIFAGANLFAKYKPAAITDGYCVGRKVKPMVYTGMAIFQTNRPVAIREVQADKQDN